MKNRIWLTIVLCFLFIGIFGMTVSAEEKEFGYKDVPNGVEITSYQGQNMNVVIPDTIDGKPVVSIGKAAFYVSDVTSVDIPASVKTIGEKAFSYCKDLTKVTFRGNGLETIEDRAFEDCRKLTQFSFPTSLKSIGDHVFIYCPLQGELDFSNYANLKMGKGVFANCASITVISFPSDLTEIPERICSGCDSLKTVMIGDKAQIIGEEAFRDCDQLVSVNLPESLRTIRTYAFAFCKSLTTITVPAGVDTIEYYAFGDCGLKSVHCAYGSYAYGYFDKLSNIKIIASGTYLKSKSITIYEGETVTLKMVNDNGKTTFSSSRKKVASVSSKGVVKGLKKGTTVITAVNAGQVSKCKVTVKALNLNYKNATITEGFTRQLKLSGKGKISWTSSNKKVAVVSSKGKVTAKSQGKATITAKRGGKKYTCKITVRDNKKSFPLYSSKVSDYPSNNIYIEVTKIYKSGGSYVAECMITNNNYGKIQEITSADINVYAGGNLFLSKSVRNMRVTVLPYGRKTIKLTFRGGEIHKKGVDLPQAGLKGTISNGVASYIY